MTKCMYAVAIVLVCVSAVGAVSAVQDGQTTIALLGEVVPCPVVSGTRELAFSRDAPDGLDAAPRGGRGLLYATFPVGGREVIVALWEGDPAEPRLWVDVHGDGDLTNVGDGRPGWKWGWQGYTWEYSLLLPYEGTDMVRFPVRFSAGPRFGPADGPWFEVLVYTGGYRRGLLHLGERSVAFAAASACVEGYFDDLDQVFIGVLDEGEPLSLRGAIPARKPITVEGEVFVAKSASPCGRWIEFARQPQAQPSPMLTTGKPFPEFEQDTVMGQRIGLDDLLGGVAVVAVGHSAMCTGAQCTVGGPSSGPAAGPPAPVGDPYEAAPLCTLLDELRELLEAYEAPVEEVQWLLVLIDEDEPPREEVEARWSDWKVVWDPEGNDILGSHWKQSMRQVPQFTPVLMLLDRQGTIAYTDSEFADRYDAFGCLRPERPDVLAPHLAWAILRLLD